MISFQGKISVFGGAADQGMANDSGLALYEPHEADLRPDLFDKPLASEPLQATWKRLRISSFYCAFRFEHDLPRWRLQETPVRILNPKNKKVVMAWACDWGPHPDTGRVLDVSPAVAAALEIDTDDLVGVEITI